jgi:hypothetical protein
MDADLFFDLNRTNAAFRKHRAHLIGVERALNCCLERTLKFLLVLIFAHLALQISQFA